MNLPKTVAQIGRTGKRKRCYTFSHLLVKECWGVVGSPLRNKEYTTRLLPDGYVAIIDSEHKQVHSLPPLAALVWELCDGKHTVSEIADEIAQSVEAVRQRNFAQEVAEVITLLTASGLLEESQAIDS